jgi:hypothetical protein
MENIATARRATKNGSGSPLPPLTASIFALVGLIFMLPPFTADSKWRSAQQTGTLPALEAIMKSGYFNPPNTMKYLVSINTLEQSQLQELAHKYALEAVKWNQDSFDLWKALFLIKNSTAEEKVEALQNMKRLDPLNTNLPSTK